MLGSRIGDGMVGGIPDVYPREVRYEGYFRCKGSVVLCAYKEIVLKKLTFMKNVLHLLNLQLFIWAHYIHDHKYNIHTCSMNLHKKYID